MQATRPVTKPSKQRKRLYNAPAHVRHRMFSAPLTKELKVSQGIKSLPVRSGDTVRIMRGDHKGFEGKVSRIDMSKYRIFVEGLTRDKVDGTTVFVPVHPSKVAITKLNLDDKWRKKVVDRKKGVIKPKGIPEKPVTRRKREKAPEIEEVKPKPVEEKIPPPEKRVEEKPAELKPAKVEPVEEKPAAAAKPKRTRKKAPRKAKTAKAEKKPEEPKTEEPKTTRRRPRAKMAEKEQKAEGGE